MNISRRRFIGGLAAGASALTGSAHAASTKHFAGYPDRYGLLHDSTLCVGCRECEAACQEVNDLPPSEIPLDDPSIFDNKRRITDKVLTVVNRYAPVGAGAPAVAHEPAQEGEPVEGIEALEANETKEMNMQAAAEEQAAAEGQAAAEDSTGAEELAASEAQSETALQATAFDDAVYLKHQCMHCNEPCCVSVCFVEAFTKTPEGPVVYDPDLCVGCRYCIMVCPYYALAYEYDEPVTPRVMRCTMCYPLIKEGRNPACADACPMGAIRFGKRTDLLKLARERIRKQPDRYIDHVYGEHEFGGTSWLVLAGIPFSQLDLHEGATHTSIPEMGSGFLSTVPLVATIFPGLLAGFYAFTQRKERLSKQEREAAVAEALAQAETKATPEKEDA